MKSLQRSLIKMNIFQRYNRRKIGSMTREDPETLFPKYGNGKRLGESIVFSGLSRQWLLCHVEAAKEQP